MRNPAQYSFFFFFGVGVIEKSGAYACANCSNEQGRDAEKEARKHGSGIHIFGVLGGFYHSSSWAVRDKKVTTARRLEEHRFCCLVLLCCYCFYPSAMYSYTTSSHHHQRQAGNLKAGNLAIETCFALTLKSNVLLHVIFRAPVPCIALCSRTRIPS